MVIALHCEANRLVYRLNLTDVIIIIIIVIVNVNFTVVIISKVVITIEI